MVTGVHSTSRGGRSAWPCTGTAVCESAATRAAKVKRRRQVFIAEPPSVVADRTIAAGSWPSRNHHESRCDVEPRRPPGTSGIPHQPLAQAQRQTRHLLPHGRNRGRDRGAPHAAQRQTRHLLPHGDAREPVVRRMRGAPGNRTPVAARTEPRPLPANGASRPKPRPHRSRAKPPPSRPHPGKSRERLLDEAGHPPAVAQAGRPLSEASRSARAPPDAGRRGQAAGARASGTAGP